jgi:hypothetical protein
MAEDKDSWIVRRVIIPMLAAAITGSLVRGYLEHQLPPVVGEVLLHPVIEFTVESGTALAAFIFGWLGRAWSAFSIFLVLFGGVLWLVGVSTTVIAVFAIFAGLTWASAAALLVRLFFDLTKPKPPVRSSHDAGFVPPLGPELNVIATVALYAVDVIFGSAAVALLAWWIYGVSVWYSIVIATIAAAIGYAICGLVYHLGKTRARLPSTS